MSQQIDAIYDNGVLRPLVPLALPDQSRVTLIVETPSGRSATVPLHNEWERQLLRLARDCGVSLSDSAVSSETLYE